MTELLDTNVAIHLRDADPLIRARIANLSGPPALSLVSVIELKGGAMAGPHRAVRRRRLDAMLQTLDVIGLDAAVVDAYAGILDRLGFPVHASLTD